MLDTVRVTYRNIDGIHVFTSDDVRGLYVADRDPRQAFEQVSEALHEIMKFKGVQASYKAAITADEFLRLVNRLPENIPHPSIIAVQNMVYNRAA
jgi:hypothetical protein